MAKGDSIGDPQPFSEKELSAIQIAIVSAIECLYEQNVSGEPMSYLDKAADIDAMDSLLSAGTKIEKMSGIRMEFEDYPKKKDVINLVRNYTSNN